MKKCTMELEAAKRRTTDTLNEYDVIESLLKLHNLKLYFRYLAIQILGLNPSMLNPQTLLSCLAILCNLCKLSHGKVRSGLRNQSMTRFQHDILTSSLALIRSVKAEILSPIRAYLSSFPRIVLCTSRSTKMNVNYLRNMCSLRNCSI